MKLLPDEAMQALPGLVLGFVLAAIVTLVATPFVRRYARKLGIVDRPEARRVNTRIVARGGGIAIGFAFISVALVMLALNNVAGLHFVDEPVMVSKRQVAALIGGAALAVAIGFLDDKYQLRARWQFLGQFALAAVAVVLGLVVTSLNVPIAPNGTLTLSGVLDGSIAAVVTLVWIVGMINSLNFIDGLDGLSSGIALIAAVTLGLISLGVGTDTVEPYVALFCFILAGALAGFLRWNFHPAKIFSGTSGIMCVGYVLAVLSILGAGKIAVALLVLGVPIMDTFWITIRRVATGRSPFAPDRGHIHHRLLDLGLSHRGTVLVIYAVCVGLSILTLVLSSGTGQMYAFLGFVLLFGLALYLIERIGGSDVVEEGLDAESYPADDNPADPPVAGPPPTSAPPAEAPQPTTTGPVRGS